MEQAAKEKPADYPGVIASILPRDINVSIDTMSDGELQHRIDQLTASMGLELVPLKNKRSWEVIAVTKAVEAVSGCLSPSA